MSHVITPTFRVSYPNVFKTRKNEMSGKDEYGLVALFKKGEKLETLYKMVLDAAVEKWGQGTIQESSVPGMIQFARTGKIAFNIRSPFKDQGIPNKKTGLIPSGYEAGAICINFKSTQKFGIVDQNKQEIIEPSLFYAGCYARAAVTAYAYDQKGNMGVSFGLRALQKVAEGEPMGNTINAQDVFEPVEDIKPGQSADSLFNNLTR